MCYKVNDAKTFKNPVYYFTVCLLIIMYITGSFNWDLSQYHPAKGTSVNMELRNTQNLNIYLHNYKTEIAIFLATKHEKTIMACSYLNFYIQKINQISKHKQQKMVAFLKNCLVKMTLRLF